MTISFLAEKTWEEKALRFLFWAQIPGAVLVGGSRLISILESARLSNVIVVEFISFAVFALISASLAKDRKLKLIYLLWFGLSLSHVAAALFRGYAWHALDLVTALSVASMVWAVIMIGRSNGLYALDPIVKGWVAVAFKALPQFMLAYRIADTSRDGLELAPVILGHLTILMRIAQVILVIRATRPSRETTGILIAEIWNELSWLAVGIVWFMR